MILLIPLRREDWRPQRPGFRPGWTTIPVLVAGATTSHPFLGAGLRSGYCPHLRRATSETVAALGLVLLIRTVVLSPPLEVEIEGRWPWRRADAAEPRATPIRRPRR